MATRIENIILRARDTLADPAKERYSDARLLRLVSEGQQDLVKQAKLLRSSYALLPEPGRAIYTLPDDVWLLTRASFQDAEIAFRSYDQLDAELSGVNKTWTADTSERTLYIVHDRVNMQQLRLYPIPNNGIADNEYEFLGGDPGFLGGEELGVVTDVTDYSFDSVFGEMTTLYDPMYDSRYSSPFGVVTGLAEVNFPIVINYFALAPSLDSVSDDMIVPAMYDIAIKYYVVGHALRDDIDTQFRMMGAESLALYDRELSLAKSTSSLNSSSNIDRVIAYSGAF